MISRAAVAALGLGVTLALAAGVQSGSAQPVPRSLPANPQTQNAVPGGGQDQQYDRRDNRRGDRQGGARRFVENRIERRLTFLHDQLRITSAQEPVWVRFADALREQARERMRDFADRGQFRERDGQRGEGSVVDRLEQREHRLADERAGLDRVLDALRPLYASFTDDQKRIADRAMFQPGEGRFPGRGGPGFGPGRGGPGLGGPRGPANGPGERADPRSDDRFGNFPGYR